jgi:hypothetical protein
MPMNSPLTRQRDFRLDDVQISSDLPRDNEMRIFDLFEGATWRCQWSMKSTLIPCFIASEPMWPPVNMRVMTTIRAGEQTQTSHLMVNANLSAAREA